MRGCANELYYSKWYLLCTHIDTGVTEPLPPTDPRDGTPNRSAKRCTTTTAFAEYGIDDGVTLIRRTYYRLVDDDSLAFEPTDAFLDRLTFAFVAAFLRSADRDAVPEPVVVALDDATARTLEEFQDGGVDADDRDLRTRVLPAFYQRVAGFYCAYRDRYW